MKILYIPGYRYPNSLDEPITSGDLRYSFVLSRALAKLGHEVDVISRWRMGDPMTSQLNGVNVFRYKSGLSKVFGTSFDISINRLRLFRRMLKNADLVICNSALSLEHTTKIEPPVIYIASGLEDTKNYSKSPKELVGYIAIKLLRDPLKKWTWKRAFLVNTTAWEEADTLFKWGVPKSKIGRVSSSVDLDRYHPIAKSKLREALGISKHDHVILSISRFTPAKGLIETIKAFGKLDSKNVWLLIIGVHHSHDDNYYLRMINEIENSKNKKYIKIIENVPEIDLPNYYSEANITSVFSKGYDPLPTVIIESMACGTPVVATYYKTREQFIKDKVTGLFVEEGDIDDWVEKVSNLLNNGAFAEKISNRALEYVRRNFNSSEIAKKYLELVEHE
jgi:glycosyltransferase involved in cell wall biosynthesis